MVYEHYRCNSCGRIVGVVEEGQGPLTCCGKEMEKLIPNTVDAAHEKHVPVVEKTSEGVLVRVGSEPHPMIPEHYIMWIEVRQGKQMMRKYLSPGDEPRADFCIQGEVEAVAYCNLHGLWSNR